MNKDAYLGTDHHLRRELHEELHARPSLYFDSDTNVWHVAIAGGKPPSPTVIESMSDLTRSPDGKHGIGNYSTGRLKWEIHAEFVTLTYAESASPKSAHPVPDAFNHLCASCGGETVAAALVLVRREPELTGFERSRMDFVASEVGGGDAVVHSTFRLNEAGFVELLLINRNLNAYRVGRMVRRLLEVETYRMMALLALPVAKETIGKLQVFDSRLDHLIEHMQRSSKVDKELLGEATKLSSDVIRFATSARHRFGAAAAYAEIVSSRLQELREGRVEQRQRIGTFIARRFQPAMRSIEAAERRLDELTGRVRLAGDLLRTTIQVQLEDQNASLLSSMDERTRTQLHIQQAVEGFSVIAITYYAVALAKICLDNVTALGLDVRVSKWAMLAAAPLALFAVWSALHRVRARARERA